MAAQLAVQGTPDTIDMGIFGDKYFSYVASFGAFTRASYATPQNIKNALGHTAYILGGISELSQIRKVHIRMEMEDQTIEDDFLFGAISNSTSYAGIVSLDPKQVDMSDGQLEVLLVRAPQNLTEITECIQAVQNQVYNCSMITFCRCSSMTVYADPDMPWTLDGEREDGHTKIRIENAHLALRVIRGN
jgi:diacylglycerol kinase family enzyme